MRFIDMHCDTLLHSFADGELFSRPKNMLDISGMAAAGQGTQFFAVFFPPLPDPNNPPPPDVVIPVFPEDDEYFEKATNALINAVDAHSDVIGMAYNADDIKRLNNKGRSAAVLTIEDGRFVNGDMEKLRRLHKTGVRAMSLTWNSANCFGYPNSMDSAIMNAGLTDFGKAAVAEMNELGMLIDVSHLSDGGFWELIELSKKPIVATHSNARVLCGHQRNLTDEMIKALAQNGGVSGINFCPEFLTEDGSQLCRIDDLCRHILHFINVGGEDCVGLGTDFDGISGKFEVGKPTDMHLLFDALKERSLSERQLEKFAYGNVLRLMSDTL